MITCDASLLFNNDNFCFQLERWGGSGDLADDSSAIVQFSLGLRDTCTVQKNRFEIAILEKGGKIDQ